MARQLDADLAAMETEEEPAANADVEMAEQEEVAVENAHLLVAHKEIVVPEAEVAPREATPREVINIPSQPAGYFAAAGPSGLNVNPENVDELLNSNHPREMLPLFQANVP